MSVRHTCTFVERGNELSAFVIRLLTRKQMRNVRHTFVERGNKRSDIVIRSLNKEMNEVRLSYVR